MRGSLQVLHQDCDVPVPVRWGGCPSRHAFLANWQLSEELVARTTAWQRCIEASGCGAGRASVQGSGEECQCCRKRSTKQTVGGNGQASRPSEVAGPECNATKPACSLRKEASTIYCSLLRCFNRVAALHDSPRVHELLAQAVMDPRSLPIRQHAAEIVDSVHRNPITVVIGETGSGKTTQISQILEEAGFARDGVIGVTQPRRVVRPGRLKGRLGGRGAGQGGAAGRPPGLSAAQAHPVRCPSTSHHLRPKAMPLLSPAAPSAPPPTRPHTPAPPSAGRCHRGTAGGAGEGGGAGAGGGLRCAL